MKRSLYCNTLTSGVTFLPYRRFKLLVICVSILYVSTLLLIVSFTAVTDDVLQFVIKCDNCTSARPPTIRNVTKSIDTAQNSTLFRQWKSFKRNSTCSGQFQDYSLFALLSNAVINRNRCRGARALGGEPINVVLNQIESAEFYTTFDGCFELPCNGSRLPVKMNLKDSQSFLNSWLAGLDRNGGAQQASVDHVEKSFTVALTRVDYANMYFVVNDWYNVFLMIRFFGRQPETTRVLLVDAHPRGLFDDSWATLFGGSSNSKSLQLWKFHPGRTLFSAGLVWSLTGACPLCRPVQYVDPPPLIDEFHRFVVTRHGLPDPDERRLNCKNVSVLFIWRHDYIAHPRNPKGTVKRKIANEAELLSSITDRHRGEYTVRGSQLDLLPVTDQLRVVGETDVMIGMHGAGLSHVVFLPRHGALIELKPKKASKNLHFADLALWRGLLYRHWQNDKNSNEVSSTETRIPVDILDSLLTSTVATMCDSNSTAHRITAHEYHSPLKQKKKSEPIRRRIKLPEKRLPTVSLKPPIMAFISRQPQRETFLNTSSKSNAAPDQGAPDHLPW